ncbi:hypothetical protein ZIOFF_008916 [Zingiber officinale]|uniref:TFIIF beta subunit HTH domain-containing protein n=1 Tax=Zingiber officinale TaxID=94328 RepID=A0A8J5LR41_ZINOF|nr:hypothetical protein ZIOFF_008916 [Zingiber officinale]
MEDDRIFLDTTRAELPVWLLKCPPAISRVFQLVTSNSFSTTSPVIAKIVHTVDLLHLDDPSSEQVLENDHGMFMRPMPGIVVGQLPSSLKEKRKLAQSKRQDAKRVRMDKGEMLNVLFRLFERQPNWGLKQLVLETNQPQQFLKEILSEICVYNKRGPNQATHELKAEYKNLGGSNNE